MARDLSILVKSEGTMSDTKKKKADFQDSYRSSSKFGKLKTDKKIKPEGDGTIRLSDEDEQDTEEIRDTVDDLLTDPGEEE
jgi:hypothetical protein